MLHTPGYTYDGDTEQETENDMEQCDPESGDQQPYDIKQTVETTWHLSFIHSKGPSEGPEAEGTNLDELETERDPDDGDHHSQSPEEIANCGGQSAKEKPDQVTKEIHKPGGWVYPNIKKKSVHPGHSSLYYNNRFFTGALPEHHGDFR